ncbi:MAG: tetratricopeptide repeat protein [Planctomycetaceae bacterium]|nr:tetratricopeptide repeat protein [Planctomycetaceae bacterium]
MSAKLPDEEAMFKVACQIASPDARADYLNQVCGDNPVVFARIAALLQVYEQESRFLESPPPGVAVTLDVPVATEKPGSKAIEFDPKYAFAYGNLGAALAKQGKLDEAIDCYRSGGEADVIGGTFRVEFDGLSSPPPPCPNGRRR